MKSDLTTRDKRLKKASASRREQGKLELKQQILEAAMELFAIHGYEGFSLRQVAEVIGYSPTTIYLYFANKDDLLLAVALEGFRDFAAALETAYQTTNQGFDRIYTIGKAYFDYGLSHPIQYRLMFMQRGEFLAKPAPSGYTDFGNSFSILIRALEEEIKYRRLKPFEPRTMAALLWSSVHGVVSLALTTSHFPLEAAEPLFEWQMRILRDELTM